MESSQDADATRRILASERTEADADRFFNHGGLFTCFAYRDCQMNELSSTPESKSSKSRSTRFAVIVSAWASSLLRTFASCAASWLIGTRPGTEVSSMERRGWEAELERQARVNRQRDIDLQGRSESGKGSPPRRPHFLYGPLDGLEGFALDSPSQEFYFPSSRANPGRFAYYVVQEGDWWFIGWRTREQVMAGG